MKYFRMNDSAPVSRRPLLKQTWVRVLPGVLVTFACLWWAVDQMRNDESGGKRPVSEVVDLVKHAFTDADYKTLPLMLVVRFMAGEFFMGLVCRLFTAVSSTNGATCAVAFSIVVFRSSCATTTEHQRAPPGLGSSRSSEPSWCS